MLYQFSLIFACLLAVAFARIEISQQLDGSMVEIIDNVIGPNPFRGSLNNINYKAFEIIQYLIISIFKCKDGSGIFKRSVLEGGLGFGINRERRDVIVKCLECSYASTKYLPGTTQINCVAEVDPCFSPSSYCCKKSRQYK